MGTLLMCVPQELAGVRAEEWSKVKGSFSRAGDLGALALSTPHPGEQ